MSYPDYGDHGHSGYNFDLINGHLHDNFPVKRNSESSDMDKKSKKRFVWPDDLHREFIAAVFDVGLSHASLETLHDSLQQRHLVAPAQIKGILARLRLFRDRGESQPSSSSPTSGQSPRIGVHSSAADPLMPETDVVPDTSPFQRSESDDLDNDYAQQAKLQVASQRIRAELRGVRETIGAYADYISNLHSVLHTQCRLHNQLLGALSQLDASALSEFQPLSPTHFAGVESMGGVGLQPQPSSSRRLASSDEAHDSHDLRQELQAMSSEMRSHMSMHRQLMMRREGQLLLHSGGSTARSSKVGALPQSAGADQGAGAYAAGAEESAGVAGAGAVASTTDVGNYQSFDIDDELFSFLLEPGSSNATNW